jgi:2-polyprenyl-6-methoxyphenol hydroxylase-like FAD-dependent oxidoreductase
MDADVLVIGAGIAGLTVAAHLQRARLRVEVAELAPELRATGAGVMLHPNALLHLGQVESELAAAGTFVARQVTWDPDRTRVTVDWGRAWDGRLPLAIHRRRLAEIMLRQLHPGTVRWATRPQILDQGPDGVGVALEGQEQRRYALVIGADGIHSTTRELTAPGCSPQPLGQLFWRSTASAAAPFDFREWRVWRNGARFFGAMPIGNGQVHVFVQAGADDPLTGSWSGRAGTAADRMMELARAIGGEAAWLMSRISFHEPIDARAAFRIVTPCWTAGRVGLVGDAAHAVSPATTQGAALAIEDAAVLAQEIVRYGTRPEALTAFEARRRPRVAAFVHLARLHAVLMGGLHRGDAIASARDASRDATAWFRRLYAPLRDAA